uniref:hepcidin-like n=1 Tax=Doryrhamphus excisus TaxID=161450 RepID=UPI0025ADA64B|nr:hepcidin-like [Doryrhamphus excisus]
MKTFSFAIAVVIALAFILIQESNAELNEQDDMSQARSEADFEHFDIPADNSKVAPNLKQKRDARACRYCCNCCSRGPEWCGLCCDW